jgi:arsenite methyltransferase
MSQHSGIVTLQQSDTVIVGRPIDINTRIYYWVYDNRLINNSPEEIKEFVQKRYAKVAKAGASCCAPKQASSSCCSPNQVQSSCGCGTTSSYAEMVGYSKEQVETLPEGAVAASAGCGNPTALASLKEGEVVLDLGSGGGIDIFLSAQKVGATGKVIGVDMTPEMIDLARRNAVEMGFKNVEFRLGDIEEMPVESGSVNAIISNCVINLAPDKDKVFREAYRVLKPGGRVMVSDIVTHGELPSEIRDSLTEWAGCVAGALPVEVYLQKMRDAGFRDVRVVSEMSYMDVASSAQIEAWKL